MKFMWNRRSNYYNKRMLLFISALLSIISIRAQEKVFEYDPIGLAQNKSISASIHIVNPADSSKTIFIFDDNTVRGLFCDKNLNFRKSAVFNLDSKQHQVYLGSLIDGNLINLVFRNKNNDFYAASFDPGNGYVSGLHLPFVCPANDSEEYYIASTNNKNYLCLLFIIKNSSRLKLYQIQSADKVTIQDFDLSIFNPTIRGSGYNNLFELFNFPGILNGNTRNLASYRSDSFYDLYATYYPVKVFSYQNRIMISFDYDNKRTTLVEIDLQNNKAVLKQFDQPPANKPGNEKRRSTSLCHKNVLLQMSNTKNSMAFTAHDITTDSLLAAFEFNKNNSSIPFLNLPFILEGKGFKAHDYLSPKKSLHQLWKVAPSISAFQFGDTLEIAFGGYWRNSDYYGTNKTGPNRIFYGLLNTSEDRFLFSLGLFNPVTFKHIEGRATPNVFIKMADINHMKSDVISGETKFESDNNYYYGFYNKLYHKYFLYRYK
jgi:hypothetical protein